MAFYARVAMSRWGLRIWVMEDSIESNDKQIFNGYE